MRSFPRLLVLFVLVSVSATARGQAPRPQFRPAVFATGPNSLVNLIDVAELLKNGQKDGAVQFGATVGPDGESGEVWTYRHMPGSEGLEAEVLKCLRDTRFTPPIYDHQPVTVMLYGTVIFGTNSKPHLRIFLNQDPDEIKAESDFIGPQPVIGADSKFKGLNVPEGLPVAVEGVVDMQLIVDEKGNLNVLLEDPPLLGFADSVLTDFRDAKFIPAFRDGDAAESKCIVSVCYKPVGVAPEPAPLELKQQQQP
jgi:hypothetical protein